MTPGYAGDILMCFKYWDGATCDGDFIFIYSKFITARIMGCLYILPFSVYNIDKDSSSKVI
jgi:hypothetical protein